MLPNWKCRVQHCFDIIWLSTKLASFQSMFYEDRNVIKLLRYVKGLDVIKMRTVSAELLQQKVSSVDDA